MQLNVDTSATGIVRVACLDAAGKPHPGYSLEDCDIIHTANEINRVVTWRGVADAPAPSDGTVRLRIWLRDADLYAFQFADK